MLWGKCWRRGQRAHNLYADRSKTWYRKRWLTITLSPWSTHRFTVRTLICEGGLSGVTWPMGRLRPRAGHDPPSPGAAQQTRVLFPLSLAAVLGLGSLPAIGVTTLNRVRYIHAGPPISLPVTITCVVQVAVFAQECWPALRSQETRRRPWACLGTCHPFAGPVGDPRFVW